MTYLNSFSWVGLLLFATQLLVIAMYGLCFSGHFPAEHQRPELKEWPGRVVLAASILVIAVCAAQALGFALHRLPVAAAIIGAGLALLCAPLVLQSLPDSFVDGRRGLAALAAVAAGLAYVARTLPL